MSEDVAILRIHASEVALSTRISDFGCGGCCSFPSVRSVEHCVVREEDCYMYQVIDGVRSGEHFFISLMV